MSTLLLCRSSIGIVGEKKNFYGANVLPKYEEKGATQKNKIFSLKKTNSSANLKALKGGVEQCNDGIIWSSSNGEIIRLWWDNWIGLVLFGV